MIKYVSTLNMHVIEDGQTPLECSTIAAGGYDCEAGAHNWIQGGRPTRRTQGQRVWLLAHIISRRLKHTVCREGRRRALSNREGTVETVWFTVSTVFEPWNRATVGAVWLHGSTAEPWATVPAPRTVGGGGNRTVTVPRFTVRFAGYRHIQYVMQCVHTIPYIVYNKMHRHLLSICI